MLTRHQLHKFLDDLYQPQLFDDFGPNGLQVEGKETIQRIAVAVTASRSVIEESCSWNADALIVHHGLFWNGVRDMIVGRFLKRIRPLILSEISLFGYHLPMDGHTTLGNCWGAATDLGLEELESLRLSPKEKTPVAVKGRFSSPVPISTVLERISSYYSSSIRVALPETVQSVQIVGICSGGSHRAFDVAIESGVDLFLSGTGDEPQWHLARESGKVFVSAGHFATERVGPLKLTKHLQQEFPSVSVRFFDESNQF
ncbi:Nif3-like dinuclear metal center hexameric protein [Candidatus Similichlamydia epinepheli]|uniref:Nif3-like dinuclear metal center hexameric protein n=1 Tax=Candidatus Similichlamydia epinepheli TaxID=1903953 RepID=UPI000D3660B8|nr:Nif3-like dinuclear metal center hexameric protein [Candidatus Similichlamydia epinepheli]